MSPELDRFAVNIRTLTTLNLSPSDAYTLAALLTGGGDGFDDYATRRAEYLRTAAERGTEAAVAEAVLQLALLATFRTPRAVSVALGHHGQDIPAVFAREYNL